MKLLESSVGRRIFGEDPAGYESGRLGYPEELFDAVLDELPQASNLAVFEVGPGTGLASRSLVQRGIRRLVLIEPDPSLGIFLAAKFDAAPVEVVVSPFEDNLLAGGQFDLGFAAASFHWLDAVKGYRQVRRLLRPGAHWAMCWNVYRAPGRGDAFADAVTPLLQDLALPPSEGPAGHVSLREEIQRGALAEAGFVDIADKLFVRVRTLDAAGMRKLYASYSFIRALPSDDRERLLDRITELVETRFSGNAPNHVFTPLYTATSPA